MQSLVESMVFDCLVKQTGGQSTVEFAIVLAAFICIAIALGAVWESLQDGLIVSHALQCASHHLSAATQGAWADVLAY